MVIKKVLVTGIGGDIGQSVIKCLKDSGYRFKIIGIDADFYSAGKKEVKEFFQSPLANETDTYSDFIKNLINKEKINYIFPSTEPEIEFYNLHRDYFMKRSTTLFINNAFIIKTFLDKLLTASFLKDNGFLYPKTYALESYNNELSYPLLLKPRRSCGGKGIISVEDNDCILFYKKRLKNYIVQEIVGSPDIEYTVGVFSDKKRVFSIAFKRRLGYGSLTKVAELVLDKQITDTAMRIARVVDLEGSLNFQLRKTDKGYTVIEVNPRFSSTVYIRHCFGFQDVKWWIDLIEKRKIEFKLKYKKGAGVRAITEIFFDQV